MSNLTWNVSRNRALFGPEGLLNGAGTFLLQEYVPPQALYIGTAMMNVQYFSFMQKNPKYIIGSGS